MTMTVLYRLILTGLISVLVSGCTSRESAPVSVAPAPLAQENISQTPEIEAVDTVDVYVCASVSAKKYHLKPECSGLKRCKHRIDRMEMSRARNQGLDLCGFED